MSSVLMALASQTGRREAFDHLRGRFAEAGLETPDLDARFLVTGSLRIATVDLVSSPHAPIGAEGAAALTGALERRLAGEPVARILGEAEFWGLSFRLTPETLVPRPDSETLVGAVLHELSIQDRRSDPLRLLDLGTGTGCLLIALLHELKRAHGLGIDRSFDAVLTARENAVRNDLAARAAFVAGDWTEGIEGPFDIVVSNPPYIRSGEIAGLSREVRDHDPLAALDGGADGLDAYRRIVPHLKPLVSPNGFAAFEVGHDQADAVGGLLTQAGWAVDSATRDLGGHARVVLARR